MIANNIDPLQTNSFGQFNTKLIENRPIMVALKSSLEGCFSRNDAA